MSAECYPPSTLPHLSRLYADFLLLPETPATAATPIALPATPMLEQWYGKESGPHARVARKPVRPAPRLSDLLDAQADLFGAGPEQRANIARLRAGARAVVTGQQVGLLGGPLLTLFKAATAVARARQATDATGVDHVPVFWLATEDHDLAEVDQVHLLGSSAVETLKLGLHSHGSAVGNLVLGDAIAPLLDQVNELLNHAPICDLLSRCYLPSATLGSAFARLMTALFAPHGLIVMDASGRDFHALGASTLRAAIERAGELEAALLARTAELESHGYAAQVLVREGASLLFLISADTVQRHPLRRQPDGTWKAGPQTLTTADLLQILESTPERLSPNALLRPLFQDTILPTAAYIGGPAEIAYFAQCGTLYEHIFAGRRITPVLPRFTGTLIPPALAKLMARYELSLPELWAAGSAEALAQRLGARAMPIDGKRRLSAAGNAMDAELSALTGYMSSLDTDLGRSSLVAASKMRYQMNRLRRMAANFELSKQAALSKHAAALMETLYPGGHLQERVLAGINFFALESEPADLITRLVEAAADRCPGHAAIVL